MKRVIVGLATTASVSGGLGLAGLGLAAGTAQAYSGPHQWCPGQSMNWPTGPWNQVDWDMNVCHTWWVVGFEQGNVPKNYGDHGPSNIWDGDNPPAPPPPQCNAPGYPRAGCSPSAFGPAECSSEPSVLFVNRYEHIDVATDDPSLTEGFPSAAAQVAHPRRRPPAAQRGRSG